VNACNLDVQNKELANDIIEETLKKLLNHDSNE
jgi:hypothetical protein